MHEVLSRGSRKTDSAHGPGRPSVVLRFVRRQTLPTHATVPAAWIDLEIDK